MEIEIMHRPSYSLAVTKLSPGERIRAEAGAMVSMSGGVAIEAFRRLYMTPLKS